MYDFMNNPSKALPDNVAERLAEPVPEEAITEHQKEYLSSIKSAYVTERLNNVFGVCGWYVEHYKVTDIGNNDAHVIMCGRLIFPEYQSYTPWQYGGHSIKDKSSDITDAHKSAVTDIISKCAGQYLGVGLDVYKGLVNTRQRNTTSPPKSPSPSSTKNWSKPQHGKFWELCKQLSDGQIKDILKAHNVIVGNPRTQLKDYQTCAETITMANASAIIKDLIDNPVVPYDDEESSEADKTRRVMLDCGIRTSQDAVKAIKKHLQASVTEEGVTDYIDIMTAEDHKKLRSELQKTLQMPLSGGGELTDEDFY